MSDADPVMFDGASARKLTEFYRDRVDDPRDVSGTTLRGQRGQPETIFAQLTEMNDDDDPTTYSWVERRKDSDGEWYSVDHGRTGLATGSTDSRHNEAYSISGETYPTTDDSDEDCIVMLRRMPMKQTDAAAGDEQFKVKWVIVTSKLPTGTGKGKVLQLIDDLDPGTPDWDYTVFVEPV